MKFHPLTLLLVGGMAAIIVWLLIPAKNKPVAPALISQVSSNPAAAVDPQVDAVIPAKTTDIVASPANFLAVSPTNPDSISRQRAKVLPQVESDPADDLIKIGQLWSSNGPTALGAILPYLTNSNPDVRALAIEAVKQVGDHSTAALLQKMAAVTEDEEQRTALEAAATFLATPTLTEVQKNLPDQPRRPLAANVSPPTTLPPENQPIPDPNAGADRN